MHNYEASLERGIILNNKLKVFRVDQDKNNIIAAINKYGPHISVVLNRPNASKVIALQSFKNKKDERAVDVHSHIISKKTGWFIDKDYGLKLIGNEKSKKWQVKNVKTGVVESYFHVGRGEYKLSRIDYPDGDYVKMEYKGGRLSKVTDNRNQSLTYRYTGQRLTSIDLPNGKSITYTKNTVARPGYGTKTYLFGEPKYAPSGNKQLLTVNRALRLRQNQ